MVDADQLFFHLGFFEFICRGGQGDFLEFVRKCKGEDKFADVVDQAGKIIEVTPASFFTQREDFTAEDGSGDAVFPKLVPVSMLVVPLKLLEILDDRGGNEELVDFFESCSQGGLLNVCARLGILVDEGIGEAEEPRGERWVAANELGHLGEVGVVGLQ